MTPTRIDAYAVAPEDDEAFLATWTAEAPEGARLHRALRGDVELRFVGVSRAERGGYAIVDEAGDPDGAGGVVGIDLYEVPDGDDERFLAAWRTLRDLLADRPGRLGVRLLRSLDATDVPFAAIARWSSPLMVARAAALPEVREAVDRLAVRSHGALYEVVRP